MKRILSLGSLLAFLFVCNMNATPASKTIAVADCADAVEHCIIVTACGQPSQWCDGGLHGELEDWMT